MGVQKPTGSSVYRDAVTPSILAQLVADSLEEGKAIWLTIVSESMWPLLKVGDEVRVVGCSAETVATGTILQLRRADDTLLTHRLRGRLNGHLITRGDRQFAYDEPFQAHAVLGKVDAFRRNGRLIELRSGVGQGVNRWIALTGSLEEYLFAGRRRGLDWEALSLPTGRRLAQRWRKRQATNWLFVQSRRMIAAFRLMICWVAVTFGQSKTHAGELDA